MSGESRSANSQIFRGRFAPVLHLFVAHLGTLIEAAQAGSFNSRDVHEDILAAVVGLNKSKSLSCVEPLHNTCRHVTLSLGKTKNNRRNKGVKRGLGKAKPCRREPAPSPLLVWMHVMCVPAAKPVTAPPTQ